MNRKSFLSTLLIALAAPFVPIPEPKKKPFLHKTGLRFGPELGLIGQGAGVGRSNPEVIAPLDKLKGMLGDNNKKMNIDIKGAIRGGDMKIFKTNKHPANELGYNEYKIKGNRLN